MRESEEENWRERERERERDRQTDRQIRTQKEDNRRPRGIIEKRMRMKEYDKKGVRIKTR